MNAPSLVDPRSLVRCEDCGAEPREPCCTLNNTPLSYFHACRQPPTSRAPAKQDNALLERLHAAEERAKTVAACADASTAKLKAELSKTKKERGRLRVQLRGALSKLKKAKASAGGQKLQRRSAQKLADERRRELYLLKKALRRLGGAP